MHKQIIAVAVAGALISPLAMADSVNVNVYGRIRGAVESINGAGDPAGKNGSSQIRLVDNSSVLGFKGTEDLGNDLLLMWQAEGQLEADGDTDGRLNSRNTFASLKGGFGTVLLGINDTPYKQIKKFVTSSVVEDGTAEISALYGKYNSGAQNFYTRQKSTLQYMSPSFGGFDFKVGFAPDESKNAATNKTSVSASLGFDHEMFFASAGFETRADATGTAPDTDSASAMIFTAGYKLGKSGSIGAGYEQVSAGDGDQANIYLTATYKLTDTFTAGVNFAKAGEADDAAETGATMIAIGGEYALSKRTSLNGYLAQIKNDEAAKYNFGDNKIDMLLAGKDPRVIGFGIGHKF